MQEKRPETEDAAGAEFGLCFWGRDADDCVLGEAALEVGSGDQPHGTVGGCTGIDVEAKNEKIFEYGGGRVGMEDAVLAGEGAKARDLAALAQRDADVLVPGDMPVGFLNLIEEDRADGEAIGTEDFLGEMAEATLPDKSFNSGREGEEVAAVGGVGRKLAREGFEIFGAKPWGDGVETV